MDRFCWRRHVVVVLLSVLSVNRGAWADTRCLRENEICVPTESCLYGIVNEAAAFIMVPRFGEDDECEDDDQVCCKKVPVTANTYSVITTTETPAVNSESEEEEEEHDWSEQCGKNANITESTGFLTNRREFPWSVAIFRIALVAGRTKNIFLCGGTLLEDGTVLTSVECVRHQPKASLRVQFGRWDLGESNERGTKVLEVEEIVIHQDYKPSSKQDNIALLFLADNVRFGPSVNRVCIGEKKHRYDTDYHCYTVGWGTRFINGANRLQKMKTFLAPTNECQESIRRHTLLSRFELSPKDVCTDAVDAMGTDYPCARITGSALVCAKNNQYFLVGIASYSLRKCSRTNVNDVFVDVREYSAWIDGHIRSRFREPSTYRPVPVESD
ncbi:hypothetical protein AND_007893 [Anopheles darlingi]|uniref:Peptidase S1 domain-containing protein n=1 Tax=Anopheles darlingi TaxID=43151 RepID=W5JCC9_ANODA|nr:hypothetical protein AND_007893 [Anopheles darlingi]